MRLDESRNKIFYEDLRASSNYILFHFENFLLSMRLTAFFTMSLNHNRAVNNATRFNAAAVARITRGRVLPCHCSGQLAPIINTYRTISPVLSSPGIIRFPTLFKERAALTAILMAASVVRLTVAEV